MMKKSLLLAICLSSSLLGQMGGVIFAQDAASSASFELADGTLTVTGKGDLSKASFTTTETVFQAAAVNKIYKDGTDGKVSVSKGETYNASTTYYGSQLTLGTEALNSGAPTSNDKNGSYYTVATTVEDKVPEGYKVYACYYSKTTWSEGSPYDKVCFSGYGDNNNITDIEGLASQQNWNQTQTGSDGFYYYCVVKGTMTTGEYTLTGNKYENDDKSLEIIVLTTSNRDQYLPSKTIVTSKSDKLYVKSGDKTISIPNGQTYTYVTGDNFYTGSVQPSETALTNSTYFAEGGDGASLIGTLTLDFLDALNMYLAQSPTTVIFKTEEGADATAQINNNIVWALLGSSSITKLDLEDTYLDKIDNRYPNNSAEKEDWTTVSADATLMPGHSTEHNKTLKTFYMPATKKGSKLGSNSFEYLDALENVSLSEGLDTLGYSCVNRNSLVFKLKTVILPNTVEVIEKWAFRSQDSIKNFVFPQTLKEIKGDAFAGTKPRDVYFLGLTAPKVAAWAWGDDAYLSNHSLTNSVEDQEDGAVVTVDVTQGVACRSNYYTAQNGWECMIHYPAVLLTTNEGKAQAARYTDLTRNYEKVVYATALKKKNDQNQDIAYYHVGEETEDIKGKSSITQSITCAKDFENMYQITVNPPYGGNYTGGYEDIYLGTQYIWPSMSMCDRATVVAQHSLLWNGVKTIGDGIRTYEESYVGDGSEYAGMHQFVFAQADVTATDTKNWSLASYADGLWHTICLPFDMTKKDMKDVFGQNAEGNYNHIRLCKFSKVERTEGDEAHIKLCFNDEKFYSAQNDDDIVLHAHTSYMIHAEKNKAVEDEKTTNVMHNYAMVAGSPRPTNIKAVNGETETDHQYRFVGNYQPNIKMPQYCYFFTKSQVFKFQGGTNGKWTAYTCVIEAPNGTDDNTLYFEGDKQQAKLATLLDFAEGEDQSTGLDKVTIEADGEVIYTTDNVYNLNGQLVSTRGLNGLTKGIYVLNGKKYIVK